MSHVTFLTVFPKVEEQSNLLDAVNFFERDLHEQLLRNRVLRVFQGRGGRPRDLRVKNRFREIIAKVSLKPF